MDIFLLVVAVLCLLIGFVGCIAPALPGPPISWLGLLLLKFSSFGAEVSWVWIAVLAAVVIVVTVLDYIVPVWGTKKFGGTKAGSWGAGVGILIGMFFAPLGIIIGPFLGAFAFELLAGKSSKHSLKAAFGAFLGFLFGVGLKLIACAWIAVYFCIQLFF
ncbi:MAG: DUF456 domain-containing protein [Prevotellaceae bacterium]|jgi:uncharacterized protein YqgC (DUF456 family)|nr:DUF456 domain-containing protein [Prevotellaceae bacterium]